MTHYLMKQCEPMDEEQELLSIYHTGKDAYPDVYWNALYLHPKYTGRSTSGNKVRPRQWALFGSPYLPRVVHMMALHGYLRYLMVATACVACPHCSEFLDFCKEKPHNQSRCLPGAHPRLAEEFGLACKKCIQM